MIRIAPILVLVAVLSGQVTAADGEQRNVIVFDGIISPKGDFSDKKSKPSEPDSQIPQNDEERIQKVVSKSRKN